jgi:N4-gp56 family major capsid protein
MSTQTMNTVAARIGKLKGDILAHVMPVEVLGKFGCKKPMPKNSSETVVFRRWLPKGATASSPNQWSVDPAAHQLSEGETPTGETIGVQDITATLTEYGFIYRWSNRTEDLYEDDVPAEFKRLTGERMGLLLEMVRYGQLKAGTNVFRAGGVASRSLVTALVSANLLRNVARSLMSNRASRTTEILSASDKVGTQAVESAWVVACHSNLVADLRGLSGFIHRSEYGTMQAMHENELGSWEEFRFIWSPELAPYLNAGTTAAANTRLANNAANSAGSELVDVYPMIVMSPDCYGDVALRGKNAMNVAAFPASQRTKDDPLGQRGSISAQTYFTAVRLNEGHMAVVEVAASFLN